MAEGKTGLTWRRGLFRVWVLASGLWLLVIGIVWYQECTTERAQTAPAGYIALDQPAISGQITLDQPAHAADKIRALTITAVTLGAAVPFGLLVLGLLIGWAARGFRPA